MTARDGIRGHLPRRGDQTCRFGLTGPPSAQQKALRQSAGPGVYRRFQTIPRARGGVSSPLPEARSGFPSSPPTWGCSRELHHHDHRRRVFPSLAGAKNFNHCFKFLENHPAEAGKGVFLPRSETRRSGAAEPRGERHAATLRFFFRSKETSFCARDARDAAAHFRKISLSVS